MKLYRSVQEMTADEMLRHLTAHPQHQIELFIKMGGDPNDHQYALISFFTAQLRARGLPVQTSHNGVWLGEILEPQLALDFEVAS